MAKAATQHLRIVPRPDQEVILVGMRSQLRGRVTLHNEGERRRTIRRGRVNRVGELVTPEMQHECTIGSGRVAAGATVTADVLFALPPSTPPGEFAAEIEINHVTINAKVVVTEVVSLELFPSRFVIENRPEIIRKRLTVSNTGNVPLTIGEVGPIALDDELLDCRTLRGAIKDLTSAEVSLEQIAGAVSRHANAALENAGILRVHNASGTQTVQSGATAIVDLEIRIPEHLDRHTRYFGFAPIYTENLSFLIVPGRTSPAGATSSVKS
jgi:hypothetical protein